MPNFSAKFCRILEHSVLSRSEFMMFRIAREWGEDNRWIRGWMHVLHTIALNRCSQIDNARPWCCSSAAVVFTRVIGASLARVIPWALVVVGLFQTTCFQTLRLMSVCTFSQAGNVHRNQLTLAPSETLGCLGTLRCIFGLKFL